MRCEILQTAIRLAVVEHARLREGQLLGHVHLREALQGERVHPDAGAVS